MYKYDFTVIVVTYNAMWEKVKLTLDSIIRQSFDNFEIIVADDGSTKDVFEEIESFFKYNEFTRYTFVKNEKNQGTVNNLLSGLNQAQGKYIRMFGPGDLFYDENSLADVYKFMVESGCEGCFGRMRGYYKNEDGKYVTRPYTFPFDLRCYQRNDDDMITKNLVVFADNASGASMCLTHEFMDEYLNKIAGKVVYLEDVFQVMAALDGRRLQFYDDYLILYEDNVGISRNKKTSFHQLLRKDNDTFYELLFELYSDNKYVKKRKALNNIYKIDNPYLRMIVSVVKNPSVVGWLFKHYIDVAFHKYDKPVRNNFLEEYDGNQNV